MKLKKYLPSLETLNTNIEIIQFKLRKNSPLILMTLGVAGVGLTAYEAYKARDRVREIVEDIEAKRAAGEDVDLKDTGLQLATAVAKPVIYGTLSVSAIVGSYHVLTNRVNLLSTALATATAENKRMRTYLRENHPDVVTAPVNGTQEVYATTDDEGKKKRQMLTAHTRTDVSYLEGIWFDKSQEYAADDTYWNETFIETRCRILSNKLSSRGFLRLTEVFDALEIPSSEYNRRVAETLGWTDSDYFDLDIQIIHVADGNGYSKPIPYIEWPEVRSIVDSIDHKSDLSEYSY